MRDARQSPADGPPPTGRANFAVRCAGCGFTWNTAVMAEGLRLLGACPKCRGELEFRAGVPAPAAVEPAPADAAAAPHRVLGIPRI
jgi:hypothetical protein